MKSQIQSPKSKVLRRDKESWRREDMEKNTTPSLHASIPNRSSRDKQLSRQKKILHYCIRQPAHKPALSANKSLHHCILSEAIPIAIGTRTDPDSYRKRSGTTSLHHSNTASLHHSNTASLHHCITASQQHCITASQINNYAFKI